MDPICCFYWRKQFQSISVNLNNEVQFSNLQEFILRTTQQQVADPWGSSDPTLRTVDKKELMNALFLEISPTVSHSWNFSCELWTSVLCDC